jgi:hypothetical protein
MKHLKILGLAVVAAAALMAFVGASSASATVLCKEGKGEVCPEGQTYPAGTKIEAKLVAGTKAKLVTAFKTIECEESAVSGETSAEEAEPLTGPEGTLSFSKCNCETVNVLKAGTLSTTWIAGTNNGTLSSTGSETTVQCASLFGTVHCIYVTEKTDVGTLAGGNPAKLTAKATIPRLTTDSLCAEKSEWSAEYEVTSPKPLFVAKKK